MTGSRSSFAIAACVSLAVHAALFVSLPRVSVGVPDVEWTDHTKPPPKPMTVVFESKPQEPVPPPDEFKMGDEKGMGYALQAADAPVEATAPEADSDQALLSLDPSGTGDGGTDATFAKAAGTGSARGESGGSPPAASASVLAPPTERSRTPFGPPADPALPRLRPPKPRAPAVVLQPGEAPESAGAADIAQAVTAHAMKTVPTLPVPPLPDAIAVVPRANPSPVPAPTTGGPTAGSDQPAADPARMSDSESDPFSKLGTATFVDGKLEIQFGRKVKTRRPKLLLAGQVDLVSLQRARVVLKIDVDATGKVTSVEVVKSSGSNEIDQPTRVAIYDWWFEPPKDASGKPVADEIQFTIGWR